MAEVKRRKIEVMIRAEVRVLATDDAMAQSLVAGMSPEVILQRAAYQPEVKVKGYERPIHPYKRR